METTRTSIYGHTYGGKRYVQESTAQKLRHDPLDPLPNIWLGKQMSILFVFWVPVKPSKIVGVATPPPRYGTLRTKKP